MRIKLCFVIGLSLFLGCGGSDTGPGDGIDASGSDPGQTDTTSDVGTGEDQGTSEDTFEPSDEGTIEDLGQTPTDEGTPPTDEKTPPTDEEPPPEDKGTALVDASTDSGGPDPEPCTEPLQWICADSVKLHKCNLETGLMEYDICAEGTICSDAECREIICTPGAKECQDTWHYKQCNGDGTSWANTIPCEEGTECDPDTDKCVVPPLECPVLTCMSANVPVDGECVPEYAEAGTGCDDEDLSTHSDQCNEEHACAGTPIACEGMVCHNPGVQNGVACDYAPSEAGGPCSDDSLETASDTCDGNGSCVGEPITCEVMLCHEPGVPNGVDCNYDYAAAGTSCNDEDLNTKNDVCDDAGSCAGEAIICAPIQCMVGAPNGEGCIYENSEAGLPCDDENDNTAEDDCDGSGNCEGEPIVCAPEQCIADAWPNGIDCNFNFSPEGTLCDDSNPATSNDVCDAFGNCYGEPFVDVCNCTETTGTSVNALVCAMEIGCHPEFVNFNEIYSPTGDNINQSHEAVNHFGNGSNDLGPRKGNSYALLATGFATGTFHSKALWGGSSITDPFSPGGGNVHDAIELSVELTAPPGAQGFSLEYVFFSEEFDDYVGSSYNDKFYIIMNAPQTTGGLDKVINFTDCRNPSEYFDLAGANCPLDSGYCCYIAINTALSECCWYDDCPDGTWTTNIGGTGFECASSWWADGASTGSSTGWLTTTWTINSDENFTLKFHVHDTSDGVWDSEVILDNFKWEFEEVTPGTGISGML